MNLRLRRLVRTASSEQYALFDLDQIDGENGAPTTVGKLDLHYTAEGLYGTLLLWDDETGQMSDEQRDDFVYALLDELSLPMGVPNEYVVEFFAPELDKYNVFHNVGLADDDADDYEKAGSDPNIESAAASNAGPDKELDTRIDSPGVGPGRIAADSEPAADQTVQGSSEPLPDFDVKPVD